jgi:hypothetical protein
VGEIDVTDDGVLAGVSGAPGVACFVPPQPATIKDVESPKMAENKKMRAKGVMVALKYSHWLTLRPSRSGVGANELVTSSATFVRTSRDDHCSGQEPFKRLTMSGKELPISPADSRVSEKKTALQKSRRSVSHRDRARHVVDGI